MKFLIGLLSLRLVVATCRMSMNRWVPDSIADNSQRSVIAGVIALGGFSNHT